MSGRRNIGAEIRAMLSTGKSTKQIQEALGATKSTVTYHAQKLGLRATRGPRVPNHLRCPTCGGKRRRRYKRCSRRCADRAAYLDFIEKWKRGEVTGYGSFGQPSDYIRRYLIEKHGEQCCLCGWAERNPVTGRVPIVIDHIDGRWENCGEDNLRLLCPNCDSLTPTYKALNRGNGHPGRRWRSINARQGEWHPNALSVP